MTLPKLWHLGDLQLLNTRCVSVIGTREPTPNGIIRTQKVVAILVNQGYTIVSGLE